MTYLTQQEIFDKVAVHLLTQNDKSVDGATCLYHGPFGLTCAVGCLIPKEVDTTGYNSQPISHIPANVCDLMRVDLTQTGIKRLLEDLQRIHDMHDVESWYQRLTATAASWLLSRDALYTFHPEVTK